MHIVQLKLEIGNYSELRSLHRLGHITLSDEEDRAERAERESREKRRDELMATIERLEGRDAERGLQRQLAEELE